MRSVLLMSGAGFRVGHALLIRYFSGDVPTDWLYCKH